MKSKALVGLARALLGAQGGEVPRSLEDLVKLPGVGRKTANVVLGVLWNAPEGVVTDTHVMRVSQRLGWTKNGDPARIELDLCAILPKREWDQASHVLIFHGRRCCFARKPACSECGVNDVCPSAFDAENVGRKPSRSVQAPSPDAAPKPRKPDPRRPSRGVPLPAGKEPAKRATRTSPAKAGGANRPVRGRGP